MHFLSKFKVFAQVSLLTGVMSTLSALTMAAPIKLVDVVGREVTLDKLPQRIMLGEGRMIYGLAPLIKGNPFKKIIGWKEDLILYDPDTYRKYKEKFPRDIARIKSYGSPYAGDFSVESIIQEKTDLVILDGGALFKAEETGLIEKLEKANIPVVFIDFRKSATTNTIPSLLILGKVLGEQENAQEFIDFYIQQMNKVTNIVNLIPGEDRPLVVVENAAGWSPQQCCWSFGPYNYGRFVEIAGGTNYGSTLQSSYSVTLSLEAIIAANPEHMVATGANWIETRKEVTSVLLGYEGNNEVNTKKIYDLSQRTGIAELDATKQGNYHVIYHQFYNSPYHFIAIQQIAKWLHPDEFEDLDPQANFDELHDKFLPYDNSGQFWISLKEQQ